MKDTVYIFLDIDGVLNSRYYFQVEKTGSYTDMKDEISPWNVSILKLFTDKFPNHKIILSSSWREKNYLRNIIDEVLHEYGLKLSGRTPQLPYEENATRGNEILYYMKEHGINKRQIVIFDDESDMGELKDRLIKTRFDDGLTFADIRKAELLLRDGKE